MSEQSAMPLVSVVIPHYGGYKVLSECLNSLLKSTYPNIEVLLVDNGSPDDSISLVREEFPSIFIISSPTNRGFAGGCNFGTGHAKGKYILILNNDTIHEHNWIEPLVKLMEDDKKIASVQPKIKNYHKQDYFDYAGGSGGYMDWLCFPFARGRIFDTIEKDQGQYENSQKIFWASGTAFLTRKSLFEKLNGFDEILFAHMEEIDYHWKSQLLGYEVWVEPASIISHHGGVTLPKSSPTKTYLNHRNSLILLFTNTSIEKMIVAVFPRMTLEFLAVVREIFRFKWNHATAIIKAWLWIIIHPSYLFRRRANINCLSLDKPVILFQESIVLAYYLRGKKNFLDLNYNPT